MNRLNKTILVCATLTALWSCSGPDVVMCPEKCIEKADCLASKGSSDKALVIYDAVIAQYCEYGHAYARRAVLKAKNGDWTAAAEDLTHSLRTGIDGENLAILKEFAPSALEAMTNQLFNECTVYRTAELMFALGTAYEAAGKTKDAYNAFTVAARLDPSFAADRDRTSVASEADGETDWMYFYKKDADGTVWSDLRILDLYFGNPVPEGSPTVRDFEEKAAAIASRIQTPTFHTENYPALAKARDIQGTVTARAFIGADGSVRNIRIMDGVHFSLDSETVRVISSFKDWKEYCKGSDVTFIIPVAWTL